PLSAFDRLSSTAATTPSPSKIRISVPRNSPSNGEVMSGTSFKIPSSQTSALPLSSIADRASHALPHQDAAAMYDPRPIWRAILPGRKRISLPGLRHRPRLAPSFPESRDAPLRGSKYPPGTASAVRWLPFPRPHAGFLEGSANLFPSLPRLRVSQTQRLPTQRARGALCL